MDLNFVVTKFVSGIKKGSEFMLISKPLKKTRKISSLKSYGTLKYRKMEVFPLL
jgi:hypothetical protein